MITIKGINCFCQAVKRKLFSYLPLSFLNQWIRVYNLLMFGTQTGPLNCGRKRNGLVCCCWCENGRAAKLNVAICCDLIHITFSQKSVCDTMAMINHCIIKQWLFCYWQGWKWRKNQWPFFWALRSWCDLKSCWGRKASRGRGSLWGPQAGHWGEHVGYWCSSPHPKRGARCGERVQRIQGMGTLSQEVIKWDWLILPKERSLRGDLTAACECIKEASSRQRKVI